MNVLSPSEGIEGMIRLLFRIQAREDKAFARFLKVLEHNKFKITDFDEISRRIIGYSVMTHLENILKVLEEYALSYSFEVTVLIKTRSINRIMDNMKKLLSEKKGFSQKLYRHKSSLTYIFCKHRCWLIQIIKNKSIVKMVLLRKRISSLETISPYYYTFYSIKDILLIREEILKDLRDILSSLNI